VARNAVIPAPANSDEEPFTVGDKITVFEAAMVYADRHPCRRFLRDGNIEDCLKFLKASVRENERLSAVRSGARLSWDVLQELLKRIDQGKIVPIESAYAGNDIDPTRTFIRTVAVVNLANERGDRPRYFRRYLRPKRPKRKLIKSQTPSSAMAAPETVPNTKRASFAVDRGASIGSLEHTSQTLPARNRGPRPTKRQAVENLMRKDISEGKQTSQSLEDMLEKQLLKAYPVCKSREVVRIARNNVLSDCAKNNLRQIATNDK
jgi:hypothetical protein